MREMGLTMAEVEARRREGRVNAARRETSRKTGQILRENILTLFNVLITPMIFLLFYLGLYNEVVSVAAITIVNTAIGIFQELKAKRALDRISLLDVRRVTVIREGRDVEIDPAEGVQGEYVRIRSGEPFLADGTLCQARYLEVDESLLTGESDYLPKHEGDPVLSGSFCASGEGVYTADKISQESYINRMASETRQYHKFLTPLQRKVNYLVKFLVFMGIILSGLMVLDYLVQARLHPAQADPRATVRAVSAIIMTLIPQGLVLTVTLIFVLAIIRMGRSGVVIQNTNAIESMAHLNVLCMDKTGTLTRNRLSLTEILPHDPATGAGVEDLLRLVASGSVEKNKTVEAIRDRLGDCPVEVAEAIPFSSRQKYSGLRIVREGRPIDLLLGAFENLSAMMDPSSLAAGGPARIETLAARGLRVLVLLEREAPEAPLRESLEGFRWVATLVFQDELKTEAREILAAFKERAIDLRIISGDHPETVRSLALQLGIIAGDRGVTGPELGALEGEPLRQTILGSTIFARITPQQKLTIIKTLQGAGFYVGMVGDGVNDALALKEAYLGIAMGSGARVSKDVADLVLLNDSFEILPGILSQGRRIIQNVRDVSRLFLIKNTYAILLIVITQFLALTFPFGPQQVSLINFITITLPSIVILGFSRKGSEMERHYLREIALYSLAAGLVASLAVLAVTLYGVLSLGNDDAQTRSMIVATLVGLGLFNYLYIYTAPARWRDLWNLRAWATVLPMAAVLPLSLYAVPAVRKFLDFIPLEGRHWLPVGLAVAAGWVLFYLTMRWELLRRAFLPPEHHAAP